MLGVSVHAETSIAPPLDVARQEKASVAAIVVDYRLFDGFTGIEAAGTGCARWWRCRADRAHHRGHVSRAVAALTASGFPGAAQAALTPDRLLAALG